MSTIQILSREDVGKALSIEVAIELMKDAFIQLSNGSAVVPVRMNLEMEADDGRALVMPVYAPEEKRLGFKLVSIMDKNPARGLPLIHALVMLFDSQNGKPLALMDGELLTALRTGATTGLATELLARKNSETVLIVGAGVQGRYQLEAVSKVREIKKAFVKDHSEENAQRFAQEMSAKLGFEVEVAQKKETVAEADIICTATTATKAVFGHAFVKEGAHINGIGAYKKNMCEIPAETIAASKLVVDQKESCLAEAGDITQAIEKKVISEDHIHAELGELAAGQKALRESETEITVFKSVGNAVQDVIAASAVLQRATELNLGISFEM